VATVLTFSKAGKLTFWTKIKDIINGLKSNWKIYRILISKTQAGYDSFCTNPNRVNATNKFPCNKILCGYVLVIDSDCCIPLFSNRNSMFINTYEQKKIKELIEDNKEMYLIEEIKCT
jgi:hypothetical protein